MPALLSAAFWFDAFLAGALLTAVVLLIVGLRCLWMSGHGPFPQSSQRVVIHPVCRFAGRVLLPYWRWRYRDDLAVFRSRLISHASALAGVPSDAAPAPRGATDRKEIDDVD